MADCCTPNDCFCTLERSADGKKLVLTIDTDKLPKAGETQPAAETSTGRCCSCC